MISIIRRAIRSSFAHSGVKVSPCVTFPYTIAHNINGLYTVYIQMAIINGQVFYNLNIYLFIYRFCKKDHLYQKYCTKSSENLNILPLAGHKSRIN